MSASAISQNPRMLINAEGTLSNLNNTVLSHQTLITVKELAFKALKNLSLKKSSTILETLSVLLSWVPGKQDLEDLKPLLSWLKETLSYLEKDLEKSINEHVNALNTSQTQYFNKELFEEEETLINALKTTIRIVKIHIYLRSENKIKGEDLQQPLCTRIDRIFELTDLFVPISPSNPLLSAMRMVTAAPPF